MTVGVAMLVHEALGRAEQVVRHWTAAGCPVVLHVDSNVPPTCYAAFRTALADDPLVRFCARRHCEWGTWSLVGASQAAAEMLLESFPDVQHVYLASGACLPLRPVRELVAYLGARPRTDFIESATTADVAWPVGGLNEERFTLRFPFAWKRQRRLFDAYVRMQRLLRLRRRFPEGLVPHMGSQWWCLTRQTLTAILGSPDRAAHERFFRRVWIPDESYFQTLVRRHGRQIESRSLTLSKFDFQGKPHVFYDDHLELLRRSDCFVARKIWPQADGLYRAFLKDGGEPACRREPNPGKIDRVFARAVERRTRGRPGLFMQSRRPDPAWDSARTAAPYFVLQGLAELFTDFDSWLAAQTGARVHGHLFAPDRVAFADGLRVIEGGLCDSAAKRDYAPEAFLSSLIWNTRGTRQCFQYGPADDPRLGPLLAQDGNARIAVVSGAWAVPLFRSNRTFPEIRREAARLQKIESDHLKALRAVDAKAQVRVWSMAEFIHVPSEPLREIVDMIGQSSPQRLREAPSLVDLTGFAEFLQKLKNQGMHPHLMGDFPVDPHIDGGFERPSKPYLVRTASDDRPV